MILECLQIPPSACVSVNIPKKILEKNGFDRCLLDEITVTAGKTQLFDRAVLAPRTCAIPAFQSDTVLCDEIHVLELTCSPKAASKLEDALFAHMPYALLILTRADACERLAMAAFRTSQADKNKNVLTNTMRSRWFDAKTPIPDSFAFPRLSRADLLALYKSLFDAITHDNAQTIWPCNCPTPEIARLALDLHAFCSKQIATLNAALAREKQPRCCLEFNQKICELKEKIAAIPSLSHDELVSEIAKLTPEEN